MLCMALILNKKKIFIKIIQQVTGAISFCQSGMV